MTKQHKDIEIRHDRIPLIYQCAAVFILSIAVFVAYVLIRLGYENLFRSFGDGHLYVSVADNFLDTGHFTQTARPQRSNMIVPFGVPLLVMPFRIFTRSDVPLTLLPFVVFGVTNVLAFLSERNMFKTRGVLSAAFLTLAYMFRYECSPVFFCNTEVWYTFFMYSALYVLSLDAERVSLKKRVSWLNGLTFFNMCVRPVLSPVYIATVCYTVWCVIKKRISVRRAAVLLLVPAAVMVFFGAVNFREAGEFTVFENYGSIDLWSANNPDSDPLSIQVFDLYENVENTTGMDYARDDHMYKSMFREYVFSCPGKFTGDTIKKLYVMYVREWRMAIIPVMAAAALLIAKDRKRRGLYATLLGLMLLIILISSVGQNNQRYTFFVVSFWNVFLAGAWSMAAPYVTEFAGNALKRKKQ